MRRLTFNGRNSNPIWSPDGQRVAYTSDREGDQGIFSQPADGTGSAERLTKPEGGWVTHWPDTWTPDGQTLLFSAIKSGDSSIWMYSTRDKRASMLIDAPNIQQKSAISRDGRWLAYQSDEIMGNGAPQIYVQAFPLTGAKFLITKNGFNNALWLPEGNQLFFNINAGARLSYVDLHTQPSFTFGEPVPISIMNFIQSPGTPRQFDITPDGKQFIVLMAPGASTDARQTQQVQVVLNWFEELKQRASH
jgi:eukaryotic-like serine/threonine-protein kinase